MNLSQMKITFQKKKKIGKTINVKHQQNKTLELLRGAKFIRLVLVLLYSSMDKQFVIRKIKSKNKFRDKPAHHLLFWRMNERHG